MYRPRSGHPAGDKSISFTINKSISNPKRSFAANHEGMGLFSFLFWRMTSHNHRLDAFIRTSITIKHQENS
jgi:hypothetical protein